MKDVVIKHVTDEEASLRLDKYLRQHFGIIAQSIVEKFLRKGDVKVNDSKATSNLRLKTGDKITVKPIVERLISTIEQKPQDPTKSMYVVTQDDLENVSRATIWEDDYILVINKPKGLAVQGGTRQKRHLDGILKVLGEQKGETYKLVHRLDQDTTGVIIFAKSTKIAHHYTSLFKTPKGGSELDKKYWAIVTGNPVGIETITAPLAKGTNGGDKEKVYVDEKEGKKAVTYVRVIRKLADKLYLVELTPITGRTHQLRVHCTYVDCPIVGDGKYGGKMSLTHSAELQLHARQLRVKDQDGAPFTFLADLPEHMIILLKKHKVNLDKLS